MGFLAGYRRDLGRAPERYPRTPREAKARLRSPRWGSRRTRAEGNVGGGTGMVCHRFKSGIGTASRVTRSGYTLGAIVQANYGRREDLTIAGVRVGRQLTT